MSVTTSMTDDARSVCSDTMSFADGDVDSPDDFICLFEKEQILESPGIKAGLTPTEELRRRQLCAQLLQEMGVRMNVSQTVVNVSVLLMHRVFMFFPAHEEDAFLVAAACFAIACKTEDSQRKLQYIIDIFYRLMSGKRLLQTNQSLGLDNANIRSVYESLVNHYLNCEALVLTANGFDVNTDLPHGHLIRTCKELKLAQHASQTSYFLCTQLLHVTTLCLRFPAKCLAFACVQLAMTWSQTPDPRMSEKDPRPWYSQLDHRVQTHQIEEILNEYTAVWKQVAAKHRRHMLNLSKEMSTKMQQLKQDNQRRLNAQKSGSETPQQVRHPNVGALVDREEGELSDHSRSSTPVSSQQAQAAANNSKLSLQAYYNKRKTDTPATSSTSHITGSASHSHNSQPNKKPRMDNNQGGNHNWHGSSGSGSGFHRDRSHHHANRSGHHQHHRNNSQQQHHPGRQHHSHQQHFRSGSASGSTQLGTGYNRRPTPQVGATPPGLQQQLPPPPPPGPPQRGGM